MAVANATSPNGRGRAWVKRGVPVVFYALVIAFAIAYLRQIDWGKVAAIEYDWSWMLAAAAAGISVRYWYAGTWIFLLQRLGARVVGSRLALLSVYAKSWLGRYVPGGATWILGKIYFASKLGISKTKLAVSSFLEGALQIIVVLASASAMLAFDSRVQSFGAVWFVGLLVACIIGFVAVLPRVFNRLVSWVFLKTRKQPIDSSSLPNGRLITSGIFAFLVSSILSGLSFFFVAKAVEPSLGWDTLLFIIGASNLASALSMLAVFAPAGLGVREGVQLATLLVLMPAEQALVITILMRVWSIAMDAVFFAIAWVSAKLGKEDDSLGGQSGTKNVS